MSGFQMPSFMKREPAGESGEHTNVHRLRDPDEVTTQPMRRGRAAPPPITPPPTPEELHAFVREHTQPGTSLPPAIVNEVAIAQQMFEDLLPLPQEARDRISALLDTMLTLYPPKPPAADETPPTVEGHAV